MDLLIKNENLRSFVIVSLVLVFWVEIMKLCANRGLLNPWGRRKLMHCLTGPIFLYFWPYFSPDANGSRYAAAVPFVMTFKFLLIGLGIIKDEDTVKSMSRSGDRNEILRGPLLYGIVFISATLLFWRKTRAVIAFFSLCFGDGFAEVIGRVFGSNNKLFWSKEKSFAGMFGFIIASTVSTLIFLHNFPATVIDLPSQAVFTRILIVNCLAALVETLPLGEVDNITVFVGASLADLILLENQQLVNLIHS